MNKGLTLFLIIITTASAAWPQTRKPAGKAGQTGKPSSSARKATSPAKGSAAAQRKTNTAPKPDPTPEQPETEDAKFQKALAGRTAAEKARRLKKFIQDHPESELLEEAYGYLAAAHAMDANEKLQAGDVAGATALFKLIVDDAPAVIPDRLYGDLVLKIPANLFYRGERAAALEMAQHIEKKVAANPKQLLALASYYMTVENGSEARRLAEAAIALAPDSPAGYQALGLAHRLNFDLEESAKAYAKAAELDAASVPAQRSLAEMKRALGLPDEAVTIYRSILAADEKDHIARAGLTMALFNAGKRADAEAELAKALEADPKNFALLSGVAYWYAANGNGAKAVEYAQRSIDAEPRYIWGHIALARGLMKQDKPVDAERVLVKARQFGNFPTLEYEIAAARFKAGLYREAVDELSKSFSVENGTVRVKLGGRVPREAASFQDLVDFERRASILEPQPADDPDTAAKMRLLMEMTAKAEDPQNAVEVSALADEFAKGTDKMKLHRQLYAANLLLQKNMALPKVADLLRSAVGNTESGLDVASPAAAVMASELYESRTIAFARNEIVLVPDVPRQTLSAILRGRIEELSGWTLYRQKSYPEAAVRLRRAISVLPEKSAWWRSSMWRLGTALEADGKDKEALESYIQSYKADQPNGLRYSVIESLYRKINGSTDGLEEKIGANPMATVAAMPRQQQPVAVEPFKPDPAVLDPIPSSPQIRPPADASRVEAKASLTEEKKPEAVPKQLEAAPEKLPAAVPADKETTDLKAVAGEAEIKKAAEPETPKQDPSDTPVIDAAKKEAAAQPVTTAEAKPEPEKPSSPQPEIKDQTAPPAEPPPSVKQADKIEVEPNRGAPVESEVELKDKPPAVSPSAEPEPKKDETLPKAADTASAAAPEPAASQAVKPPAESAPEKPAEAQPIDTGKSGKTAPPPSRKPRLIIEDTLKKPAAAETSKGLFDPVVINVPRRDLPPKPQEASAAKAETSESAPGSTRRRVIEGKDVVTDQHCSISVSKEVISLLSGGSSLGVLVSIAGEWEAKDVTASSSSFRDVEVRSEPEIAGLEGRRFYVIKSISDRPGVYQVKFESPCGTKEVTVHVR